MYAQITSAPRPLALPHSASDRGKFRFEPYFRSGLFGIIIDVYVNFWKVMEIFDHNITIKMLKPIQIRFSKSNIFQN